MKNDLEKLPFAPGKLFIVDNYLEAAGVMTAIKSGVSVSTVRRPLPQTQLISESAKQPSTETKREARTASTPAKAYE
jgi:hypothetical protein